MAIYNKLVVLNEIDNVEKAKLITHDRLIRELNERQVYGGEQFGSFVEVIHEKAQATYQECVEFGRKKNQELDDAANSTAGRWYFHRLVKKN